MSDPLTGYVWDLQISQSLDLSGLLHRISERFARYVRPMDETCLINQTPPATKSPSLLCSVGSPNSRGVFRICPAPGADMSGQPISQRLSLGAPDLLGTQTEFQRGFPNLFCSLSDMFGSLTPQQANSMWGYKRGSSSPLLIWPLHWLEKDFNLSFLNSNPLSQASIKSKPFRRDLRQTISVCSLLLRIHPLDRLGILREPSRLWWVSESLYWPLLHGDLIVENWTWS
jgi:hypothetical protein